MPPWDNGRVFIYELSDIVSSSPVPVTYILGNASVAWSSGNFLSQLSLNTGMWHDK